MSFSRQAALVFAIAFTAAAAGFWVARLMPHAGHEEVQGVSPRKASAAMTPVEGSRAAPIALPDSEGKPRTLADWPGKWLLVNFWATWCAPCMHEIPALVAAQTSYSSQGLQVLGVAMDDPEAVRELMQQKGFNYPSLVGDEAVQGIMERYGNTMAALPYTVLLSPDGVIRYVELGGVDTPKLDALMARFLPR